MEQDIKQQTSQIETSRHSHSRDGEPALDEIAQNANGAADSAAEPGAQTSAKNRLPSPQKVSNT
ncbi:hypothetical protein O9929_11800 [Vibrio lentus]|nr:hypothetical protein [Vibrio lentus]